MKIRMVKLCGGPCDGAFTMASHDTAWNAGELYCKGDQTENPDEFEHVKTRLSLLSKAQFEEEKERVYYWMTGPRQTIPGIPTPMPRPMSELIGIPPWRINMWYQLLKVDPAINHS